MITGDLPPSSSDNFFPVPAVARRSNCPTLKQKHQTLHQIDDDHHHQHHHHLTGQEENQSPRKVNEVRCFSIGITFRVKTRSLSFNPKAPTFSKLASNCTINIFPKVQVIIWNLQQLQRNHIIIIVTIFFTIIIIISIIKWQKTCMVTMERKSYRSDVYKRLLIYLLT